MQVTGGELFDRIVAKGSYTEADAAEVIKTLCQALAYMHQKKARPAALNRGCAVHPDGHHLWMRAAAPRAKVS